MLRDEYFKLYASILSQQYAACGMCGGYAGEDFDPDDITEYIMRESERAAAAHAKKGREERERIADELDAIRKSEI